MTSWKVWPAVETLPLTLIARDWTPVPGAARSELELLVKLSPAMTDVGNGEPLTSGVLSGFTAYKSLVLLAVMLVSL